jgi:hypothetical protein
MTKKVFFMLILAIAGIASMNGQMRIGGSETPNKSAVLDLNPDNDTLSGNATLGLALPRVNLRNSGDAFPLVSHVKGMTVYNMATAGDVSPGVYINNGVQWLRQLDSSMLFLVTEKDSVVGNEITNATTGGGLIRSGDGTAASPYTLGVTQGGITTDRIADKNVTFEKLADTAIIEIGNNLAGNMNSTVLGDSIINYITQNFNTTELGDSMVYYLTQHFETLELGDTIVQYITNNLDNSALMDSIAAIINSNNSYLTSLIDNIAQNVYHTALGDSIVNYISSHVTNTLLGDSILQYITADIRNTVLGDSIINLVHENERDGIVGNEVTNATVNGGLIRSGAGTAASPYTLGIATGGVTASHIADNTLTNADINTSAAIALSKIALPDATANSGKVLKSNGSNWVAGEDSNSDTNTTYSPGNGLTLSGTTFSIGAGQVTGTMIADGAVESADLSRMNASTGQVLKWNGTAWMPSADAGITTEQDGIIGNEVTNATGDGGLTRSGSGTTASPYTLGITAGGVTNTHLANGAVTSEKISDNAVTSAKIADGTISNADINASAAIALNKIALPDASTNNGKVLKSNGTAWIAGDDSNSDSNTTYTAGSGLTLAGTTFSIGTGQVNSTMIADGAVVTAKLADKSVAVSKVNATGTASSSTYLRGDGSWSALAGDGQGVTSVSGANGITVTNGTTMPTVSLPAGTTSGNVLKWNGTVWASAVDAGITSETDGVIGNEITNATTGGGLVRSGTGTAASPYTLGIAVGGVTNTHLADNAVTSAKITDGSVAAADLSNNSVTSEKIANNTIKAEDLNNMGATNGQVLTYSGSAWEPKNAPKFLGMLSTTVSVSSGSTETNYMLPTSQCNAIGMIDTDDSKRYFGIVTNIGPYLAATSFNIIRGGDYFYPYVKLVWETAVGYSFQTQIHVLVYEY